MNEKEGRELEPVVSAEITREADDHIALGLLLRKDRQEPKKSAVQKVLSSALTTAQKVDKIREIDDKQDSVGVIRVLRQASAQAARGQVSRISKVIKSPVQSFSYFSFLLREYGRVRQFGRRTHVLDAGIWPPGIKLDPNLPSFLVKQLQAWAGELSPRLQVVVDHGWLHLTPRQYNHIVLVKRLSDRIQSFDFLHLNLRDMDLIDRLKRIESLFLMLHYHGETVGTVLAALRTFYEKQHDPEPEIERTHSLVARLLSQDITLPSLYNCLIGLNIFKRRRFLTMSDLVREGLGEMVDGRGFDCDAQVRTRMDGYIGAQGRVSFGSAELLEEVWGVKPGAVTPFGAINDAKGRVTVVLDAEMMRHERLNFHPLVNTRTTGLASPISSNSCARRATSRWSSRWDQAR